ncbi:hypothetical protein J2S70_000640 [Trueperella bonasi]|uniref:Uncharacterized protein n=1 Tax=Trueperella bonasi TaxID=312286 RepID=A0ABT9NGY3_9ACTO|nr:hypothetical protein [Trueperella bonasi]MDP9806058.1 hypothetical protein [Trueperella bonasi]
MSVSKRAIAAVAIAAAVIGAIIALVLSSRDRGDYESAELASEGAEGEDETRAISAASPQLEQPAIADHTSAEAATLDISKALFESAPVVIVAAQDSWAVASYGALLGVPALVTDNSAAEQEISQEMFNELDRLQAEVVLVEGIAAEQIPGYETYALAEAAPTFAQELGIELTFADEPADVQSGLAGFGSLVYADEPAEFTPVEGDFKQAERSENTVVLTDGAHLVAIGSAVGAGAAVQLSPIDPRASSQTITVLDGAENVAAVFGEENPDLPWQIETATTGTQLPGGGQLVFDGKRYIALYGSPHTSTLGVLGEQGVEETIVRAQEHAAPYQELTDDQVIPALEIIVTVASGAPGDDGNYSNEWALEGFIPLIEAAQEAGQYVVLDFQPGRADFLTQVQQYEPLFEYPHVGVALDPEWRLGPDEMPLSRIGHVEIDEVNAVVDYLADFTREQDLPQKMLILHQFQVQMLRDIEQLDQSRSELAILIHVDGQGSQNAKQDTWRTLVNNAQNVQYWGWKNFYDEDIPMLDPVGTYQVEPLPDFVSYQ